ncbi:MAG: thioredoxin family protein [Candidatus Aenigmarchaeota archaeon]|nr:thioredoxin family protein [Candidatus Aenigmarchaeota archaeon]
MKIVLLAIAAIVAFVLILTIALPPPVEIEKRSNLPLLGKAPEFVEISGWINSEPVKLEDLKGKVVLVDFWTYSCINCIRTLPYINSWNEKYSAKGLVIIGVHTPEFEFEKDYNNVKSAVEKYGVKYAVAQDNNYSTWRAYKNNYWPRKYLVDKDGNIRYDHIGEGGYEETEKAIQELLDAAGNTTSIKQETDFSQIATPELYLGYNFIRQALGNEEGLVANSINSYKTPNITQANIVYLEGKWKSEADRIIAVENASVYLIYKAKNVNIVSGGNSTLRILIGMATIEENYLGQDTNKDGSVIIAEKRLYNIISAQSYDAHLLEIRASLGFELYTFTFG